MVGVKVKDGESIDEALRRFKRECARDGILRELKKREYFRPASVVRKEKLQESLRRRSRMRKMARRNYYR